MTEPRLTWLAAHPVIAQAIRALTARPPVEIVAEGTVRLAAILLGLRERRRSRKPATRPYRRS